MGTAAYHLPKADQFLRRARTPPATHRTPPHPGCGTPSPHP